MPANLLDEELLSLGQAGRSEIPGKPNPSTLWRWHTRGVRGVKLETVVLGGRRWTSREAISRFAEASTRAADSHAVPAAAPADRSAVTRDKLVEAGLVEIDVPVNQPVKSRARRSSKQPLAMRIPPRADFKSALASAADL